MVKGSRRAITGGAPGSKKRKAPRKELVTRDYTIHLSKRVHDVQLKKRAPRAIKEIRSFACKAMGTKDVRIDTDLNKFIWGQGIRYIPNRVRVRIARRRNDDQFAAEHEFALVSYVPVESFAGLQTVQVVDG